MDWITGILTVLSMELISRKRWQGFAVGLVNQVFWIWLSIERELYGLLLLSAVLTIQYLRGIIRWRYAAHCRQAVATKAAKES